MEGKVPSLDPRMYYGGTIIRARWNGTAAHPALHGCRCWRRETAEPAWIADRPQEDDMHRRSLVLLMAIAAVTVFAFMRADSVSAQAVQVAPVAHTGGPYTGNTGIPIQFNASLSSGVGLTYQWD